MVTQVRSLTHLAEILHDHQPHEFRLVLKLRLFTRRILSMGGDLIVFVDDLCSGETFEVPWEKFIDKGTSNIPEAIEKGAFYEE